MKNYCFRILSFFIIFKLFTFFSYGQTPAADSRFTPNDGRAYISIYENPQNNNSKNKRIWEKGVQFVNYVNPTSQIEIRFLIDKMKSHQISENISLQAYLNESKVEISPYFEVGKEFSQIGVKSFSVDDIYNYLKKMYEISSEITLSGTIDLPSSTSLKENTNADVAALNEINRILNKSGDTLFKDDIREIYPHVLQLNRFYRRFRGIIDSSFVFKSVITKYLPTENEIRKQSALQSQIDDANNFLNNELKLYIDNLSYLYSYFESINKSSYSTNSAFIKILNTDRLNYDNIVNKVKFMIQQIGDFIDKSKELAIDSTNYDQNYKMINKLSNDINNLNLRINNLFNPVAEIFNMYSLSDSLDLQLKATIEDIIYSKFINGTIDLRKVNAQVGQTLYIYLVSYSDQKMDILTESPLSSPIASFTIKETGFYSKINESLLLIDRYNIADSTKGVSPSHYKGAPGISFSLNY
jgi:hypothetical protein